MIIFFLIRSYFSTYLNSSIVSQGNNDSEMWKFNNIDSKQENLDNYPSVKHELSQRNPRNCSFIKFSSCHKHQEWEHIECSKDKYTSFLLDSDKKCTNKVDFVDISLFEARLGYRIQEFHKNKCLYAFYNTSEFERSYLLEFINETIPYFNDIIKSEEFTDNLLILVHDRQFRKYRKNLSANPSRSLEHFHFFKNAFNNSINCAKIICSLKFTCLRDFIYYFSSVLFFTKNFRLFYMSSNEVSQCPDFNGFVGINLFQLGFTNIKFNTIDLIATKKILSDNIFSLKEYNFKDFVDFVFSCFICDVNLKKKKTYDFVLIFRLVYLETYIYFENYYKNHNIIQKIQRSHWGKNFE
ncbi:hypothetical protein H312_03464 [Anncaliia algerae PRA339]|uniref:Uncharacterized protein n=1 Tax=Anncaliia algerae PRA339 TaxID=1288291 RepID=A0A059EW69_9MICR|nr:hypothetical protein H312_03464 [Anncaliia algerae PRA339]